MPHLTSNVFAIDVDDKPTVTFVAGNWREAQELIREEWFRADLSLQMSDGIPLCTSISRLKARYARPEEIAKFERHRATLSRPTDDLELVYLVEVDTA